MDDYDVYNEMQNLDKKLIVAVIEDDEDFVINELMNIENVEVMPIRLTYDLFKFSKNYIECTKTLFTYYFNKQNNMNNELLKLKKHFIHYRRTPMLAYIPINNEYTRISELLATLNIPIYSDKNKVITRLKRGKRK